MKDTVARLATSMLIAMLAILIVIGTEEAVKHDSELADLRARVQKLEAEAIDNKIRLKTFSLESTTELRPVAQPAGKP